MKPRDILVATHGHCFDGMASAALFTYLARALDVGQEGGLGPRDGQSPAGALAFRYKSCGYGPGMQQIPASWLDGDDNAILDFRYTGSQKLGWYFDHHVTAFGTAEERDAAIAGARVSTYGSARVPADVAAGTGIGAQRPQVHFDPTYSSCAKLIADVAAARFGVDMSAMRELITWADLIDSARFASADAATSTDEPVMRLAAVVEHHGDGPFLNAIVPRLLERSVAEVAASPEIQEPWKPIAAARSAFIQRVEKGASVRGAAVFVDLTDRPLDVAAKFVTYALYPSCVYSVTLSRNKQHYKLSVGYNPWSGRPRGHDIASICRRYDGGGHPAVGACSFPLGAEAKARAAAETVIAELLT